MASASYNDLLNQQGYLIIPNVVSDEDCKDFVTQIWDVLESLPRKPEHQLRRPQGVNLTMDERKELVKNGFPHYGFGGPVEPPMCHLNVMWKVRQDPKIYKIFADILGEEKLWVEINRPKVVLPTCGTKELCHVDNDPHFWENDGKAETSGLHCIVSCCDGMKVVLSKKKTWTKEFTDSFKANYPHNGKKRDKVQIGNHDPLHIKDQDWQTIPVPKGAMVIWSNKLFHSAYKNTPPRGEGGKILYGFYHGFQKAESRPEMANTELGLNQWQDRIRSYLHGFTPFKYPSGDKVHYTPYRWVNYPKMAANYAAKYPDGHPQAQHKRVIQSGPNKGELVTTFKEPAPHINYTPPKLTELGQKLLGLVPWEKNDEDTGTKKRKIA